MKIVRLISAVIFLFIFLVAVRLAMVGGLTYEDLIPEKTFFLLSVNGFNEMQDKVLKSDVMTTFLKETGRGKEWQKKIDDFFAAGGFMQGFNTPSKMYVETYRDITIYYAMAIPESGEAEEEEEPKEKSPQELELERTNRERWAGIFAAAMPEYRLAYYGDPITFIRNIGNAAYQKDAPIEERTGWVFLMDMGKLTLPARFWVNLADQTPYEIYAKKTPKEKKGERVNISYAFVENFLIAGSPEDVRNAIDRAKGDTPSLKSSELWKTLAPQIDPESHFNLVVIPPNLIDEMMKDEVFRSQLEEYGKTVNIKGIKGLVFGTLLEEKGLTITTKVFVEPGNPIMDLLDQNEKEMAFLSLLPDEFTIGSGLSIDNYLSLWTSTKKQLGEIEQVKSVFTDNVIKFSFNSPVDDFLKILKNEIVNISFYDTSKGKVDRAVQCAEVKNKADTESHLTEIENKTAAALVEEARETIETARNLEAESYAPERFMTAESNVAKAQKALTSGQKALSIALARRAKNSAEKSIKHILDQTRKILDKAIMKGAYIHCPEKLREATKACDKAEEFYEKKDYSSGEAQVRLAKTLADEVKALIAKATGKEISPPSRVPFAETLAPIKEGKTVAKYSIRRSSGDQPVFYTFLGNYLCFNEDLGNMEAFLKTTRGKVAKTEKMKKLLSGMPKKTQVMIVTNLYTMMASFGLLDPEKEDVKAFLKNLNLHTGTYLVTDKETITLNTYSPLGLFNGSTENSAKGLTIAVFLIVKFGIYLIGLIALYLMVRTLLGLRKGSS